MAASLFLLLAVILAFAGGGGPWTMVATVALATASGTTFPDLDSPLRLQHRSAVVHSVLPLYIAMLDPRTWPVAAGLGFGIGFHLAADLFPTTMRGYATIKMPLLGAIGVLPSYLWIAVHAGANLVGGVLILERIGTRPATTCALAAAGVLGAAYLMRTQGGLYALALLTGLGWLMLR